MPPAQTESDSLNEIAPYSGQGNILSFGRLDNDDFPADLPDGHICMDKVVMVDETKYDEEMRCHHMYTQSCHQKYETVFKQAQVLGTVSQRINSVSTFTCDFSTRSAATRSRSPASTSTRRSPTSTPSRSATTT